MIARLTIFGLILLATSIETVRLLPQEQRPACLRWFFGRAEAAASAPRRGRSVGLVLGLLGLGVLLRYVAGLRGFNYDVESYFRVSELYEHGMNVYANTGRYNYGPLWFHVLGFFRWVSSYSVDPPSTFTTLLTTLLTLVDLGIFLLLQKRVSTVAGLIYFLNPISIIISGYHRQFDNAALLLGLGAVLLWERGGKDFGRFKFASLVLLGFSLMLKHILFLFPLWMAFFEKEWRKRLLIVALPCLIFLAGFLPYWSEGSEGILRGVFGHSSSQTATFWKYFVTGLSLLADQLLGLDPKRLFILSLASAALWMKRATLFDSFICYICLLIILSSAIENQYLAIPAMFIAVYINSFLILYILFSSYFLAYTKYGLQLYPFEDAIPYDIRMSADLYFVFALLVGFVVAIYRPSLCSMAARIALVVREKLGLRV